MGRTIRKKDVGTLFARLEDFLIYGPVEEDGTVLLRQLKKGGRDGEPVMEFSRTRNPAKEVVFPRTERMFEFEKEDNRFIGAKRTERSREPVLVWGVRPCDAKAMTVLDQLFNWDYQDPYYNDRRSRTTLISLACTQPDMPKNGCFCTSLNGSPGGTDGADMLWTDIGDEFHVEALTEKGKNILRKGEGIFAEATSEQERRAEDARRRAEEATEGSIDGEEVRRALDACFESDIWAEISERCLGCGVCTLLCPTCHCFDINDVIHENRGWRERTWDTCQDCYYTVHASGHNPRPDKKHRQRNRLYHKFLYMVENLDEVGCVGCGRCIELCPVNIDITEVAGKVTEVAVRE